MSGSSLRAAEFFAGIGLVRAALDRCGIQTVFANDIDKTKAALYRANWGTAELHVADVRDLRGGDIPTVDLATASFPCVDVSLAGQRRGLAGSRSSVVFDFLRILGEMRDAARMPRTVMLENVPGFLTAHQGKDFRLVVRELSALGYRVTHLCVDARAFVPQSRVRVFIVGRQGVQLPLFPEPPPPKTLRLADYVDATASGWWPPEKLARFLMSLSPRQAARVEQYQADPTIRYFGAYRRTRNGTAVWEVRADECAGALRTTRGGSAKQALLRAGQGEISVRWMNTAEYARLQGAEDLRYDAVTPQQAMFALGDAVCVPAVEWLGRECLLPLLTP